MNVEGARDFTAGGEWAEIANPTWRPGMAPGAKTLAIPRDAAITDVLAASSQTPGLWIDGRRSAEEIAALAALPSLSELSLWPADAAAAAALVKLATQIPLRRIALVRAPASALVGLEGLAVPELSASVEVSGESDAAGLTVLFGLALRHLRVRSAPMPLPIEAARALAARATVEELFAQGLGVTSDVVEALVRTPTLHTLTLDKFGTPGALRIEGSSSLRRLELVGTMFERLEVERLPALERVKVFSPRFVRLSDLPRLRFFQPPAVLQAFEVELHHLPVLEHVYGPAAAPSRLELRDVPMLRVVDVDGSRLDAESRDALGRSGARVTLGRTEPAKQKKTGEKRKLKTSEWKSPRLGALPGGHGVVIAGRIADDAISGGKARELAVACEVWAQKVGRHLAGLVPLDLTRDLSYARVAPVLVGEVVGYVGDGRERVEIDVADAREALERLSTLDDAFWAEAGGIVGTKSLSMSAPALYLIATGPTASAMLRAGAKLVTWVDVDVVAWTAIDLDAVASGVLTLEAASVSSA